MVFIRYLQRRELSVTVFPQLKEGCCEDYLF